MTEPEAAALAYGIRERLSALSRVHMYSETEAVLDVISDLLSLVEGLWDRLAEEDPA